MVRTMGCGTEQVWVLQLQEGLEPGAHGLYQHPEARLAYPSPNPPGALSRESSKKSTRSDVFLFLFLQVPRRESKTRASPRCIGQT